MPKSMKLLVLLAILSIPAASYAGTARTVICEMFTGVT